MGPIGVGAWLFASFLTGVFFTRVLTLSRLENPALLRRFVIRTLVAGTEEMSRDGRKVGTQGSAVQPE